MGKKAKEHRRKVEKRKRIQQQEMKRFQKIQQQLLEKIMSEQQSTDSLIGSNLNPTITESQVVNSTILNGPLI